MLRLSALITAVILAPATSSAQTQIGVGVGYAILSGGSTYEGVDPAIALGGHLSHGVSDVVQIGIGFDYSSHGFEGSDSEMAQIDILATVRYLFPSGGVRFFMAGNGGFTRQSITITEFVLDSDGPRLLSYSVSAKGFAIGPTVGVQIPAGRVSIELAADGLFHSYGNVSVDGATAPDSDDTGFRVVPRVGMAIPIGG